MSVLKPHVGQATAAKKVLEPPVAGQSFERSPAYRIAIVGCGPRGMRCLESLSRNLPNDLRNAVQIVVFEPAPVPGAGAVYDPRQPRHLRMNFAARNIDFWKVRPHQSPAGAKSLLRWLEQHSPHDASPDAYVPRAVVGEYLSDCFSRVVAGLQNRARLQLVRATVDEVRRSGDAWLIDCQRKQFCFDQVAVTTGHEGLRRSRRLLDDHPSTFAYFAETLNERASNYRPSTHVLVRGFGLTAIDAVLSLTEGQGGRFMSNRIIPRYVDGGASPGRITLQSRSGRPMLAKPTEKIKPIGDRFWKPFRDRLRRFSSQHGNLRWHGGLFDVFTQAAADLLCHDTPGTMASDDVSHWYQQWCRRPMDGAMTRRILLQSYAVACGMRGRDIPFALGAAWRALYPELVRLISYGGLAPSQWEAFQKTATEMERIAFGPPAESVGKLLSLLRCRRLRIAAGDQTVGHFDHTIDAVLAGPHEAKPGGPLARLVASGLVALDKTSGAVMVDRAGRVIGVEGLAVFGRATEGWILGNDTLTHTTHPQIERWAASVASRLEPSD